MPVPPTHRKALLTAAAANAALTAAAQVYVIATIGLSADTDAMYAAQAVYLVVFAVLGSAISMALTPVLSKTDAQVRNSTFREIFAPLTAALCGASALMLLTSHVWLNALFPALGAESSPLATRMAEIYSAILLFALMNASLASAHRANSRFLFPETADLISTMISLAALAILLPRQGISAVPVTSLLKALTLATLLLVSLPRHNRHLPGRANALREFLGGVRSTLMGFSVVKTGPLIDRQIASAGGNGELALVSFASTIFSTYSSVVDRALVAPQLVQTASAAARGDLQSVRASYRSLAKGVFLLSLGISMAIVALAEPGVRKAVAEGWRAEAGIHTTWTILAVMSLCLWGVVGQIAAGTLYGLDKHRSVARAATANFLVTTIGKIALYPAIGVYSIAAGAVAYQLLNSALLHLFVSRIVSTHHEKSV